MLKADGSVLAFFSRPIAGVLGIATLLLWTAMLYYWMRSRRVNEAAA